MKGKVRRWAAALLAVAILAAAVGMITLYSRHFSRRIYEESTGYLQEIYTQVNNAFISFAEKNWGILEGWEDYINSMGGKSDAKIGEFIRKQQEYWRFTDFYFLTEDGQCMKPDGSRDKIDLSDSPDGFLPDSGRPSLLEETMSDGKSVTMFTLPVEEGEYRGFAYDAIAISYSNVDMAESLNVEAFSGKSQCFVVYADGSVLLSTQTGGNVFGNYLSYLRAGSDLSGEDLQKLQEDWETGTPGILRCKIGNAVQYISYQPIGYQDCILLGVVPEQVANSTFRQIQAGTVDLLVKIFLMVGLYVFVYLIYRNWKQTRQNRMELEYRDILFDIISNNVDDIFLMLEGGTWKADYVSPNVERLLGVPKEAVLESTEALAGCLVDPGARVSKEELGEIPVSKGRSWEQEYRNSKTGELRWYRETVYHEKVKDMEKFLFVLSDRTQERMMNQSLQEALDMAKSANEAKSHFLANMSHDIRTPMNAIVGFAALLEKDAGQQEKVREYSRKISSSSKHLLSLINDVLDMSKIESGKTSLNVEEFDLPELLEELNTILRPQAKAKSQSFKTHMQGTLTEQLTGDKLRLNQILINLLSNAIKYTPDGGKIDFFIQELPKPSPKYARLRFVVKDNGIGMSEEFLKSVFDPFAREESSMTSAIQGTGLGMAITKNLVDLMGGTIQVESRLGEGTTFTVEMSFALPDQVKDEAGWLRQKVRKVLVVNGQEDVCRDVREVLRGAGLEASYVTTADGAVREVSLAHAQGADYQAVLLDTQIGGESGLGAASRIKEELGEDAPILALASHNWSEIEDEARKAGIDAFLPKPFFVSTFWQALAPLFSGDDVRGEEAGPDEAGRAPLEGLLFLVAEDVELNAEVLYEMMKIEGASCEFAVNGKEAVELFEKSEPGHYDMILMDVQMPVMDGYEAARRIRASSHPEASTIPIVAMTANAFAEDVRNALDAGMNAHLAKPIDMEAVKALIGKILKEPGGKEA